MRCDPENTEGSDCADPRIQKGMTTVESDTKELQESASKQELSLSLPEENLLLKQKY